VHIRRLHQVKPSARLHLRRSRVSKTLALDPDCLLVLSPSRLNSGRRTKPLGSPGGFVARRALAVPRSQTRPCAGADQPGLDRGQSASAPATSPESSRGAARFPHVNLHVKTTQSLANFKSDGVDIAIRFGTGDWKGLRAIKLLDEEFFPVCSPSLNGGRLPKDPASILSQPLLIDRHLSWHAWFKSVGLKLDRDIVGTSFTDANSLMEAAVTGQGIALGRISVTRTDILAGKLVRLSEHSLRVSYCHYAVYPIASESNPALVAFRDWLIEEAHRA
jgi:DNA-binding transcriptional LysR family regulator